MLIAKHGKPFTEGTFIKDCVMKLVKNVCKQEFTNVCLVRNTVVRRVEDISTDIQRQVGDREVAFDYFSLVISRYFSLKALMHLTLHCS